MTRYRRRSSCRGDARQLRRAETVPNTQEIQIGMLQHSAVRERSGGYARREGQAHRFRRAGRSNVAAGH